ncbi:MAG: hypothetical protein ABL956_17260, partial [Hyphomonadaceae bacterium]
MIDKKIAWALILAIVIESAGVFAWAPATGEPLKEVEMRGPSRNGGADGESRSATRADGGTAGSLAAEFR